MDKLSKTGSTKSNPWSGTKEECPLYEGRLRTCEDTPTLKVSEIRGTCGVRLLKQEMRQRPVRDLEMQYVLMIKDVGRTQKDYDEKSIE